MADATLAQAIRWAAVDFDRQTAEYKPVIAVVRELIGVVPNCNPYLEIWPPAWQTFNVLIPNLLNLPSVLVGQGAPKDLIGLAMYVASRETGCMYCTAHHCSFAIRRGTRVEAVVDSEYTETEAAVADLATAMVRVPSELSNDMVVRLAGQVEPAHNEWIVLAVAMSGFLTKFMDTMGVELEEETVADVEPLIGGQGWVPGKHQWDGQSFDGAESTGIPTDNFGTIMRVMRRAPGAIRHDARWTRGVSGRLAPALMLLEEQIGYAFPILAGLRNKKAIKAITTALRVNLDRDTTKVGMAVKCMVALIYAEAVSDEVLRAEAVLLADIMAPDLDPTLLSEVSRFGRSRGGSEDLPGGLSTTEAAALQLAKASAPSPVEVNEITISAAAAQLTPEQIIEVVTWMAVLQMLHRLYVFYDAKLGLT